MPGIESTSRRESGVGADPAVTGSRGESGARENGGRCALPGGGQGYGAGGGGRQDARPGDGRRDARGGDGPRNPRGGGTRRALAAWGEDAAVRHLEASGYRIVCRNYRCRLGELDIVAWDGPTLVFVEVKTRRGAGACPEEAVDGWKRARLARIARHYLASRGLGEVDCRFDVVAVGEGGVLRVIRDAFQL